LATIALGAGMSAEVAFAGGSPSVVYCTTLTACPTGAITSYDFTPSGSAASAVQETFYLYNKGGSASSSLKLSITQASSPGAFQIVSGSDTCTGTSIGMKKSCHVTVQYNPTSGQTDTARLTAVAPRPGAVKVSLNLSGSGGAPHILFSPYGDWNFFHTAGTQDTEVYNNGTAPTGTYSLTGPADTQHFSIAGTTCDGSSLPVGGHCTLVFTYTKTPGCGSDVYQSTIDFGSLASFSLQAQQDACNLAITGPSSSSATSSSPYDFGQLVYGAGTGSQFTVTNNGTGAVTLGTFASNNTSAFRISNDTCSGTTLQPTGNPGNSCTLTITAVDDNSCSAQLTQGHVSATPNVTAYVQATMAGCANLTIAPTSVSFPSAGGTQSVTVSNIGTASSGSLDIGIDGDSYGAYSITTGTGACDGPALMPGDSCTIYVADTPPTCGDTTVTYDGMLIVGYSNAVSANPSVQADLSAPQPACASPAKLTLSPGTTSNGSDYSYEFGGVQVGTTVIFTLANTGGSDASVFIGNLQQSGVTDNFSIAGVSSNGSSPCTIGGAFPLQAGSSCTFAVSFILNNCTNGVNVNAETAISGGTGDNRTLTVYGYKSGC
jgi:hypothetical protein